MASFFEGVTSCTTVRGEDIISVFDTVLLQVNLESPSFNGWLTRTECIQSVNGDLQHQGFVAGSCVEELAGYLSDDGELILETNNVIEMQQSGSPWSHSRYVLRIVEDGEVLVGEAQPLDLSRVQKKYEGALNNGDDDNAEKLRIQIEAMQKGTQEGIIVKEQRLRLRLRDRPSSTKLRWEGMACSEPGNIGNHTHQSWNLVVLEWDGEEGEVSAPLYFVNCLKQVDGQFEPPEEAPYYIRQWGLEFGGAVETLIGNFDSQSRQLILHGTQVKPWGLNYTRWPTYSYNLKMSNDNFKMAGERKERSGQGQGPSGVVCLFAKRHMLVNVSAPSGVSITCMNLVGDVLAELKKQDYETVKHFRARLAASLPNRGLSVDMLKIVLPSGVVLDDAHNDLSLASLL